LGSVAFATQGTDTTPTAKTEYFASIFLPVNKTLTGAAVLNGSAAATDKVVFFLHNNAGAAVAQTASAGTAASGANAFQEIAFTGTYAAVGPARYFLGYQADGTTTRFRSVAAGTSSDGFNGTKALAAFGTAESVTAATTFSADTTPIGYVY